MAVAGFLEEGGRACDVGGVRRVLDEAEAVAAPG
jgi:hypothetical protein